jgi:hypothetical protein
VNSVGTVDQLVEIKRISKQQVTDDKREMF